MTFNRETLRPEYRLVIGEAGESCAFYIAQRLGFPEALLGYAKSVTYGRADGGHGAALELPPPLPAPKSRIEKTPRAKKPPQHALQFETGDSVVVYPGRKLGIVYRPADEMGSVVVQVQGRKYSVRHSRLKMQAKAADLYPADYDFSILFYTVENRKARHQMDKGKIGVEAVYDEKIETL